MTRRPGRSHPANLLLALPAIFCALVLRNIDSLWLEALLLVLVLTAVAILGNRLAWTSSPPAWCHGLQRACRKSAFAFLLPALASIALRVILLPWLPIPHPVVPDEFSHILLAKTLLLGRLANPPHPLWQHFESIHILSQPTYSSMYMAGQACFLAAGELLFGNMFWGVVLSTALFCGAVTWFLRAWVPPGWALFGGLLVAVRIGGGSYWNDSYWGGSAGALGGAMVLGAYPRLVATWKPLPALIFASGLVVLANTRPYEGAVLGAVLVMAILFNLYRANQRSASRIATCFAIAIVVLSVSGYLMTRQFKAVTGNAVTLPYQVNQTTYGWPLTLPWTRVLPVRLTDTNLKLYRDFEIREHRNITDASEIHVGLFLKYAVWWRFFFGISLSAVFFFTGRILRARRTRVVWVAGAVTALAVITEQSGYPHYWSPIAPVIVLFIVQGLRYLWRCHLGSAKVGQAIVCSLLPVFCLLLAARETHPTRVDPNFFSWCCVETGLRDREPIVRRLQSIPGNHLVFVTYNLTNYDTSEWVYNEPDIDHSRIVFARDMGDAKNRELIRYYDAGRKAWRVTIQKDRPALLEPFVKGP